MRNRLRYANVMATLAFFFALTGGAMATVKYLQASDPITQGDLAGSTYGKPLIANSAVSTAKILDGSITSAKFDSGATAPSANAIAGLNVTTVSGSIQNVVLGPPDYGFGRFNVSCPPDRIAFNPQVTATTGSFYAPPGMGHPRDFSTNPPVTDLQSYNFGVDFTGSYPNAATGTVSCLGSGS